jgi:hypothetical protein
MKRGLPRSLPLMVCMLLALNSLNGLSAATLSLHIVSAKTGEPLPDVILKTGDQEKQTDSEGAAAFEVSPNLPLEVMAYRKGFAPMSMRWKGGSVPGRFEFRLPETESIGGRIIDEAKKPVANATIAMSVPQRLAGPFVKMDFLPIKSDAEGRWNCDWTPKDADYMIVEVSHPDYEPIQEETEGLRKGSAQHTMRRVNTLSGRVLDEKGQPVANASLILGAGNQIFPSRDTPETRSDERGHFEFRRISAGQKLIGVKAEGFAPMLKTLSMKSGSAPLELHLSHGAPLRLQIVDKEKRPIPGATVQVTEFPSRAAGATTAWDSPGLQWQANGEGRFVWSNAPPQTIGWSISKPGFMGLDFFPIKPSEQEQTIVLLAPFRISGKVIDAQSSKSIDEFVLNSRFVQNYGGHTEYSEWPEYQRKKFSNGKYSLEFERPLLLGSDKMHDWQFRVEAEGYQPVVSPVFPHEASGTNFDFALQPAGVPLIAVDPPTNGERVSMGVAFQTKKASTGQAVGIFIRMRIAPGHHIYALDESGSNNQPTAIKVKFPPNYSFSLEGPWRGPEPKVVKGQRIYEGDLLFRNQMLAGSYMAQQTHKFSFEVTFQVCNEALCWPPEKVIREAGLEIVSGKNE